MSADNKITSEEVFGAVHDARQMLAVITGRVGLLSLQANNSPLKKNLAAIELAALGVENILERLQQLAKGNSLDGSTEGDIWDAVRQATDLIQPRPGTDWQWQSGHLSSLPSEKWLLNAEFIEGCLTSIDQYIIREVISNLLLNSLMVMPEGGVMKVNLKPMKDAWALTFLDSGPGIPLSLSSTVFDAGVSASKQSGKGIGLGYCRNLLEKHGGNLDLISGEHSGACFQMTLPKLDNKKNTVIIETASEVKPSSVVIGFQPQILVVDDELSVREMLQDVFEELGCEVKVARDAPRAEQIFSTSSFKMAIIDQSLPGMNGLDLAKRLRIKDPNMVLVLISGWGQEEILAKALKTDVDLVATKPLTLKRIIELLSTAGALYHQRSEGS